MEVVLFTGIQATGKSTFYRRHFFHTHVRVSLDLLKTRHRERRFFELCLETGQPVVVDNTNPTVADRARYIPLAREANFQVVGYYFQSALGEAIRRNAARPLAEQIPIPGIGGTAARLQMPSLAEGFDLLHYVRIGEDGSFVVEAWRDEDRGGAGAG